jgi:hypothetical protein
LFDIDYDGFISAITLPSCNNPSLRCIFAYSDDHLQILNFENGSFVLNIDKAEAHYNQFRVFAETAHELAILDYYEMVCDVVNLHLDKVGFPPALSHFYNQLNLACDIHSGSKNAHVDMGVVAREILESRKQ